MARIAQTARMQIRVGDKTLDTRGITPRSPLEEQAMLIWYTAHARVAAADDAKQDGGGVTGSFNMHWHIKDLFSCTDDEARAVSSRVRQVLKKTSAARCISVGGAGHSPIWWVSDTLPDNIVTVAEWVTANPHAVEPGTTTKLTRAEKRLSEHEAGEDRPAAPVTVIKAETGDEVTATFTELADPPAQDMEAHEVEVEGPVEEQVKPPVPPIPLSNGARATQRELLLADIRKVVKRHGPMTAFELGAVISKEQPDDERWQIDKSTFRDYVRDLGDAGRLHSRLETRGERNIRQLLDRTAYFGKFSRLWSVDPNPTERHYAFNVETGERFTAADVTDPVPVPPNRTNPLVGGETLKPELATGPVTVVVNAPAPVALPTAGTFSEQMLAIGQAAIALAAQLPDTSEIEDLRVMNGLLEEENARLRTEVEQLREINEKEKKRAAQVRALYGG